MDDDDTSRLDALAEGLWAAADEALNGLRATADEIIAQQTGIIRQLIALCTRHGLNLEALSIASGVRLPPKRKRGRPKVKDERYRWHLAMGLALFALRGSRVGARSRLATELAEAETRIEEEQSGKRSPAWRREQRQRRDTRRNDLSHLPREVVIEAEYYARRFDSGESAKEAEARFHAALEGDEAAEREVFEVISDLLHDNSRK